MHLIAFHSSLPSSFSTARCVLFLPAAIIMTAKALHSWHRITTKVQLGFEASVGPQLLAAKSI